VGAGGRLPCVATNPTATGMLTSAAQAHVSGVRVDWSAVIGGGRPVDLPTYPFQRERYWINGFTATSWDAGAAGLGSTGHRCSAPLPRSPARPGAADRPAVPVDPPVAGRPRRAGNRAGARHRVRELAGCAGEQVDCPFVEELTLGVPLVLPEQGAIRIQAIVQEPAAAGRRVVNIHSRPDGDTGADGWIHHATAILARNRAPTRVRPRGTVVVAPGGAAEVDLGGFYEDLTARGYSYGPAFQALRAAWRRGREVFAEVGFSTEEKDTAQFGLHRP